MNISLEYFLAVAEEESISRAAERVMVSQQDMSNHIRRLEKQYGLLFERRPRFALTPAGEAVLATTGRCGCWRRAWNMAATPAWD